MVTACSLVSALRLSTSSGVLSAFACSPWLPLFAQRWSSLGQRRCQWILLVLQSTDEDSGLSRRGEEFEERLGELLGCLFGLVVPGMDGRAAKLSGHPGAPDRFWVTMDVDVVLSRG